MSRWFRFYDDVLNDPKVQTLPPELFKLWVNLLCVASKNGGQLPVIYQLTYLLRRRSDRLERDFNTLLELGLFDLVEDRFEPHNWNKRQYKSDLADPTAAERMRRYRDKHRNGTVTVTVPRVQNTDTEAEKKKERAGKTILPDSWSPSPVHFQLAEKLGLPSQSVEDAAAEMRDWSVGNGERRTNWDSVFSNWLRRNAQRRNKNGHGRQGPLSDDRSASRAAGRLAEAARRGEFTFGPRPGLLPRPDGNVVSLLPARRDDES